MHWRAGRRAAALTLIQSRLTGSPKADAAWRNRLMAETVESVLAGEGLEPFGSCTRERASACLSELLASRAAEFELYRFFVIEKPLFGCKLRRNRLSRVSLLNTGLLAKSPPAGLREPALLHQPSQKRCRAPRRLCRRHIPAKRLVHGDAAVIAYRSQAVKNSGKVDTAGCVQGAQR